MRSASGCFAGASFESVIAMAGIFDPKMTLSVTPSNVTVDVTYDLLFQQYEKQWWLKFSEHIEVIGSQPSFTMLPVDLTVTAEKKIHRHRTITRPRHFFDRGALPVPVQCLITVKASPPVGAEKFTNSASVPSRNIRAVSRLA
jgi:hypothetical protein